MNMRTIKAICIRTSMIGGGTSYDVYFRCVDKPSRPLHGYTYATVVCHGGIGDKDREFYQVADAIDPKGHWAMEQGWDKYDESKRLEKKADRLAVRIAKRAFPELKGQRRLPALWASCNLPSAEVKVPVKITLPE